MLLKPFRFKRPLDLLKAPNLFNLQILLILVEFLDRRAKFVIIIIFRAGTAAGGIRILLRALLDSHQFARVFRFGRAQRITQHLSRLELVLAFVFDELLQLVVKHCAAIDFARREIINNFCLKLQNTHSRIHAKRFVEGLALKHHALLFRRSFDLRQGPGVLLDLLQRGHVAVFQLLERFLLRHIDLHRLVLRHFCDQFICHHFRLLNNLTHFARP